MGGENEEAVRRWHQEISRWHAARGEGADPAVEAIEELMEPDVDYYPVRKFPEAQPCHGRDELARFLVAYLETWSVSAWRAKDVVEVGDDRVLVCAELTAEGQGSGIRLEGELYHCYWLRHGRFLRIEDHLTLKGALHALGLEGDTIEAAGLRP